LSTLNTNQSEKQIREICLRLLTRREHSQLELLNKIALKGFVRAEIQMVIEGLADNGWQSDQRFTESYARFRIKKGYGPIKISYELQQRGVECCDLETVVLDISDSWCEILERVYRKKYPKDKLITTNEWLKRTRFLQQRGFSNEMINSFFKQLSIQLIYP
jgi:regulatory protein